VPDCNANCVSDDCDITTGTNLDINGDLIPDDCEVEPFTYRLDDGRLETRVGARYGGGTIWFNAFDVWPGGEIIDTVEIAWGRVANGTDTTIAIWTDPTGDGDPNDAVLVRTVGPVPVENQDSSVFSEIAVPPTFVGDVGDVFFVGALVVHLVGEQPRGLDGTSPSQSRSWAAFGEGLEDLTANEPPPTLADSFGLPGNWLLRCRSLNEDCNEDELHDQCNLDAETSNDNNQNWIPDECGLGSGSVLRLVSDSICYDAGDTVDVEVWMEGAEAGIVGGQFLLEFDERKLDVTEVEAGGTPISEEIYHRSLVADPLPLWCEPDVGRLDMAAGVTAPSGGAARMPVVTFIALDQLCFEENPVRWPANNPLGQLATVEDESVLALLLNLDMVDDEPPALTVSEDLAVWSEPGECDVVLGPGPPSAVDDCTDAADIEIWWERSYGLTRLTDPYDVSASPITISWHAADSFGNTAHAAMNITVLMGADLDHDGDVDLSDLA